VVDQRFVINAFYDSVTRKALIEVAAVDQRFVINAFYDSVRERR
jgi:hypothetical protein